MLSSVIPFFSCLQSFPASGSFQMSQFFAAGGQSIGVSASALVLPMNIQDCSPLGWIGWISLQSKGLSRVFSNTTVQKHQFFFSFLYSPTLTSIHTYSIISSANIDNFTSYFLIWIPCISFSFLIAVVKNSKTTLNNSGKNEHPGLVLSLEEYFFFSFSPLRMMFAVGLLYMIFVMLR